MKKTAVVICTVLGFVISFYVAALPARAATVDVFTGAGFASAVAAASNGDTINITQDITISAEVIVTKTLIINGNGHVLSVPVPGLNDSGVYNSNPSTFRALKVNVSGKTLSINNLTIKGGQPASNGDGAGILVDNGAKLILTRVTISNSRSGGSGGGLYSNGIVYLIDSSISRNAGNSGGGFRNSIGNKMYIENSIISENRSTGATGGGGAGENNGTLYVNNSSFANNKSTELGGAINNNAGALYVLNSTFTGNVAYSASFRGGAIAMNNAATATLINSVFAYNYRNSGTAIAPVYTPSDVYLYYLSAGPAAIAYNCVFQAPDDVSVTHDASNITYSGAADGSDDTIFSGGATAKVLAPDGSELGTNTVYQPFLVKAADAYVMAAAIKTGSSVISAGMKTGFSDVYGSTVVGYYDGASWVTLVGSNAGNFEVTTDQNHVTRASTPAIGALETGTGMLYMLKINSATGGTVNGGSIYGDVYPSGTSIALTGLPSDGYSFTRWDYVLGGVGTASTSNPYTLTISQNTTLVPVFSALTGYTVTYIGNGNTSGTVSAVQTADADATTTISGPNTLAKTGYQFSKWNTRADGSGTDYATGSTYTSSGTNLVLYAQYQVTAPDAPTNAAATAVSSSAITLIWTDNSSNETGFIPGYSSDNNTFADLASMTGTSQSFTGLSANTQYWFHVAATNSGGNSAYASTSGKYTLATPPTVTSATANDPNSITVSWSGGAASAYQVSYAGHGSGWIAANSYSFNGLNCNTAYTFIVSSRNGDGVETDPVSVSQSTPACASAFIPSSKPDVSSLKIAVSGGGTVAINNLSSDVTQIAISANSNFNGVSWENISDKDKLFQRYADASELYVKFRNSAGGVSDTVIYRSGTGTVPFQTLNEGDIVKTADNFNVYIIKYKNGKQYKRLILSPSVFNSYHHLRWENVKIISQAQMDQYATSPLVKETIDTVIYELTPLGDTGKRKPLLSLSDYDADSVYEINKADRDSYVLEN